MLKHIDFNNKLFDEISKNYIGKRILITGGIGYLGTNLMAYLRNIDCQIVCLDKAEAMIKPKDTVSKIVYIREDIQNNAIWERALERVDIVFHFAAQTSVHVANQNPFKDFDVNVKPMVQLLEVCRQRVWHPAVLFSGTVTEAGIPTYLPVDESHPDKPITIYDLHKFMAENYLKYYANQKIVKGAILRLANVYGPGPKSSSADRGVLNMMIHRALQGENLTLYGKGDYLRDYIYVGDVARAFLMAGASIEYINGQHFVIGSGEGRTLEESFGLVAERARLKTGKRVQVVNIEPPTPQSPIEARNFIANSHRFSQLTGWSASYSLCEGIDRTIEFFSN